MTEYLPAMRARLLVIADPDAASRISRVMQSNRVTVYSAELGGNCLKAVLRIGPDFIILDARSPSPSLVELCRCIRSIEGLVTVPLVALVRSGQPDYLDLIESGADDCWPEPIDAREFQIRLTAFYRRLNQPKAPRRLLRGAVELDLDRYTVRSSGPPAQLTAKQLKVLEHLMEHAGVFISHRDLLERVWGDPELDQGAVRTCMKRLRQILSATGAVNVIRSVKGGYLFDTEVAPMRVPWRSNDHINEDRRN